LIDCLIATVKAPDCMSL